jgi:hypothetical protein
MDLISCKHEKTVLESENNEPLLGMFTNLQRATISFIMSVCLSAWNNSAPTGQIFMKFDYFLKICQENSSLIKI